MVWADCHEYSGTVAAGFRGIAGGDLSEREGARVESGTFQNPRPVSPKNGETRTGPPYLSLLRSGELSAYCGTLRKR